MIELLVFENISISYMRKGSQLDHFNSIHISAPYVRQRCLLVAIHRRISAWVKLVQHPRYPRYPRRQFVLMFPTDIKLLSSYDRLQNSFRMCTSVLFQKKFCWLFLPRISEKHFIFSLTEISCIRSPFLQPLYHHRIQTQHHEFGFLQRPKFHTRFPRFLHKMQVSYLRTISNTCYIPKK